MKQRCVFLTIDEEIPIELDVLLVAPLTSFLVLLRSHSPGFLPTTVSKDLLSFSFTALYMPHKESHFDKPPHIYLTPSWGLDGKCLPFVERQEAFLMRSVHGSNICESRISQGNRPNHKKLRTGIISARQTEEASRTVKHQENWAGARSRGFRKPWSVIHRSKSPLGP